MAYVVHTARSHEMQKKTFRKTRGFADVGSIESSQSQPLILQGLPEIFISDDDEEEEEEEKGDVKSYLSVFRN